MRPSTALLTLALSLVTLQATGQDPRAAADPAPLAMHPPPYPWPYSARPWSAEVSRPPLAPLATRRRSANMMGGGIVMWALGGIATWFGALPLLMCAPRVPNQNPLFCGDTYVRDVGIGIMAGGQLLSIAGIPFFLLGTARPHLPAALAPEVRMGARSGELRWAF